MPSDALPELPKAGFNFENFHRNEYLVNKGLVQPRCISTGTTIAGIKFKDGVVLGADKRATSGSMIVEKYCNKIHDLGPNMSMCGAGTAADCDAVGRMILSQLELHRLSSGKEVPVRVATTKITHHLYRYQGYIGAALVLGGVDKDGIHLYEIHPHGSISSLSFVSMGSGSLAAMSVLESRYKENLELEEAMTLIKDAILAGVENDLGSGTAVDLCIITPTSKKNIKHFFDPPSVAAVKKVGTYKFKRGTTPLLSTKIVKPEIDEEVVRRIHLEPMDVA